MEFNIVTPTLAFSATSLLMLAYTNRFHVLENLIREYMRSYQKKRDKNTLKQIKIFGKRLRLIMYVQKLAVLSFLFCVTSMYLIFTSQITAAKVVYGAGLITLFMSLLISLHEVSLSIKALAIEERWVKDLS